MWKARTLPHLSSLGMTSFPVTAAASVTDFCPVPRFSLHNAWCLYLGCLCTWRKGDPHHITELQIADERGMVWATLRATEYKITSGCDPCEKCDLFLYLTGSKGISRWLEWWWLTTQQGTVVKSQCQLKMGPSPASLSLLSRNYVCWLCMNSPVLFCFFRTWSVLYLPI